jgi:hypothetical protein
MVIDDASAAAARRNRAASGVLLNFVTFLLRTPIRTQLHGEVAAGHPRIAI